MGKDYKLEINENISFSDSARASMKSGNKINGKSEREVVQYIGNKDKNVISEIEKQRRNGKKTKVVHRLWRWIGGALKKVHEHEK